MDNIDFKRIFVYSFLLILFLSLAYAKNSTINHDSKEIFKQKDNLKFIKDNSSIYMSSSIGVTASSEIEIVWPEPGYYYVADYMQLELNTNNPSVCSYSLDGSAFETMEETGGTSHYHTVFHLSDNMNSDLPYVVDFKCIDGGESTAETYFWINTTDIDKYFIRHNIEGWEYHGSDLSWSGNEEGELEDYRGYYYSQEKDLYAVALVSIFDNENSVKFFLDKYVLNDSLYAINNSVIDANNVVYIFGNGSAQSIVWNSGNKFIWISSFKNESVPIILGDVPLEIISLYLNKYPSQLRYGVCGDGKVDIMNLEGKKEECDSNYEVKSCSFNLGVCTTGQSKRECSSGCMWEDWSQCRAINSSNEICNNLDDDCDGETDEGNICINENPDLIIYSPNITIYNNTKVQFNITLGNNSINELSYIDWSENKPKFNVLCKNCNEYGLSKKKIKTFKDGEHNLTIKTVRDSQKMERNVSFFVDSKKPQISKIEPKQNYFSNGSGFLVKYTEDNVENISLNFNVDNVSFTKECNSGKNKECLFNVDLGNFDGEELEYWFGILDIAGNIAESKKLKIKVDTTAPVINQFNYTMVGKNVLFMFNITEKNFEKISYIDWNDKNPKEKTLCSKLKNGMCIIRKTLNSGELNLTISVLDEAGNFVKKRIGVCEWRPTENYGLCDAVLGYYYNGQSCVALSGCINQDNKIPFISQNECNIKCLS